jgi:hypothetical protein
MVRLLTALRACLPVGESAVGAWLQVSTPDEQEEAGRLLAELADLRRHLREAVHARRRAAAQGVPQEPQRADEDEADQGTTLTAAEKFARAVLHERAAGAPAYLRSRFTVDPRRRMRSPAE